ncbi:MAG: MlaD family protein [Prevotellaceae bacterium]|jgi:phospholipid/cholesterol/gamma-HCH transport system substrate-binding protein|nr:MlaD family protein [Prevotellaceae bacterium]
MAKRLLSSNFKIGLMVIIAVGLLFFGMNFLKGMAFFASDNTFYVHLNAVDGLQKSLPVNIRGYKVGQIADIRYEPHKPDPFTVVLFVNKKNAIPATARVEIYEDGLLGGKAVRIIFDAADLQGAICNSGDTIPAFVTGGLMSNIQNDLLLKISNVAMHADSLIYAFRLLAADPHLHNSFEALENTVTSLSASSRQLNTMLNNDVPKIMTNVTDITADFKKFSGNVGGINIAQTVDSLTATIENLKSLSEKINSNEGTLGALMNDKQLYINLQNLSENANKLMLDLKENPKKYVHFSVW